MDLPARARFAAIASGADDQIALDEAALLIAAEHCPGLDVDGARGELDALAARVRTRIAGAGDRAALVGLIKTLAVDVGFRGNADDYYDPRNSYLNEVLLRRTGIPITLSIVYLEVARRIGLPLIGINFPGHFLVRYPGPDEAVVLDVFAGAVEVCDRTLTDRLHQAYRGIERTDALAIMRRLLRGAARKDILARMLTNLKMIFLHRQDLEAAIGAMDRILLLIPGAADELRDRGAVYHQLECFGAALADYSRYLTLRPAAPDAGRVRAVIADLERAVATVH